MKARWTGYGGRFLSGKADGIKSGKRYHWKEQGDVVEVEPEDEEAIFTTPGIEEAKDEAEPQRAEPLAEPVDSGAGAGADVAPAGGVHANASPSARSGR